MKVIALLLVLVCCCIAAAEGLCSTVKCKPGWHCNPKSGRCVLGRATGTWSSKFRVVAQQLREGGNNDIEKLFEKAVKVAFKNAAVKLGSRVNRKYRRGVVTVDFDSRYCLVASPRHKVARVCESSCELCGKKAQTLKGDDLDMSLAVVERIRDNEVFLRDISEEQTVSPHTTSFDSGYPGGAVLQPKPCNWLVNVCTGEGHNEHCIQECNDCNKHRTCQEERIEQNPIGTCSCI